MNILVDAMGGDNAPEQIVLGAVNSIKNKEGFDIELLGDSKKINDCLDKFKFKSKRIMVTHCSEIITNDDQPTKAIKNKKDSSMVVGLRKLKEKNGDVFLSAGSTGALMAGSLLILGRIVGVDRPALTVIIPTKKSFFLLIDAGSNTTCKPINYVQFATMGSMYMKDIFGIKSPKVGLINIGTEERKGTDVVRHAYKLLSKANINFTGNIESRHLLDGGVDIAVCDGFVGNVVLKLIEGAGYFFANEIKNIYTNNVLTKLSAVLVKKGLNRLRKKMDYEENGGVPILGVDGKVFKCHGSSKYLSIENTIYNAINFANSSIIEQIGREFKFMEVEDIG